VKQDVSWSVGPVKLPVDQGAKSESADRGADKNLVLVLAVKMTASSSVKGSR
jgi:hypothetical protein